MTGERLVPWDFLPLPPQPQLGTLSCVGRRSLQRVGRKAAVGERLNHSIWALNEMWGSHSFEKTSSALSQAQRQSVDMLKRAIEDDPPPVECPGAEAALRSLLGTKAGPSYAQTEPATLAPFS